MKLADPGFDEAGPATRNAWFLDAVGRQIAFAKARVPFWRQRLADAGVSEEDIQDLDDLARIPILTKETLRELPPASLLPEESLGALKVCRWTSGTTGRPTVNFWAQNDWNALVEVTARALSRHAPGCPVSAFNGYSQAHLTGPLYDAALRSMGAIVFDRSHHSEEEFASAAQMALFRFNTLVLPDRAKRGKGVGVSDLLESDRELLGRNGVLWWIGSSGTFAPAAIEAARTQGVQSISNLYGSSEFGLFAVSCQHEPEDFHIAQGHVLVEVVDASGTAVSSGRSGSIVVSHLAGLDGAGNATIHAGTQLLRLANGDWATFIAEPCSCGLTTPRLRHIRRGPHERAS